MKLGAPIVLAALVAAAVPTAQALADVDAGTVGGLSYVNDSSPVVVAPAAGNADAECPGGTGVTGGGGAIPLGSGLDAHLNSLYLFDDADGNQRRDDGFGLDFWNQSGPDMQGSVYAICKGGSPLAYQSKVKPLLAGQARTVRANCPGGTSVTGGGAFIDGTVTEAVLHSSFPSDDGDANSRPDDGWRVRALSLTAVERQVTAYAVCWRRSPQYAEAAFTLTAGQTLGGNVECPGASHLMGAGANLSGTPSEGRVRAIEPSDSLASDADAVPDDFANAVAANASGADKTLTRFAICKP